MKDPTKTIAKLFVSEPETLTLLSEALHWPIHELLFHSGVFDIVEPNEELSDMDYRVVDYFINLPILHKYLDGGEVNVSEKLKRVIDTQLLRQPMNIGVTNFCLVQIQSFPQYYVDPNLDPLLPKKSIALVETIGAMTVVQPHAVIISHAPKHNSYLIGRNIVDGFGFYKSETNEVIPHSPDLVRTPLAVVKAIVYTEIDEIRSQTFEGYMDKHVGEL